MVCRQCQSHEELTLMSEQFVSNMIIFRCKKSGFAVTRCDISPLTSYNGLVRRRKQTRYVILLLRLATQNSNEDVHCMRATNANQPLVIRYLRAEDVSIWWTRPQLTCNNPLIGGAAGNRGDTLTALAKLSFRSGLELSGGGSRSCLQTPIFE